MSTHLLENLTSPDRLAVSLPEPGTLVPGADVRLALRLPGLVRGSHRVLAVRLPGLTSAGRAGRCGFTLVELLVVVFILLLVSAVSIPIVAPALQGRHLREASRQVNSFFAVARDTALRNGRPVGVSIERFISTDQSGNPVLDENGNISPISDMSVLLQQVEVPENYSGDTEQSLVTLECTQFEGTQAGLPPVALRIVSMGTDVGWSDLVRVGDQIRLGTQKKIYEITWTSLNVNKSRGSYLELVPPSPAVADFPEFDPDVTQHVPSEKFWAIAPIDGNFVMPVGTRVKAFSLPTSSGPHQFVFDQPRGEKNDLTVNAKVFYIKVPYTIIRQPVKTSVPALQLTGSVVLDLNWSGYNTNYFVQRDTSGKLKGHNAGESVPLEDKSPIVILFSPNGSVTRLYLSRIDTNGNWSWTWAAPTSAIHLLLGQREGLPEVAEVVNWLNPDSLWVSIHPQTGLLTTTENAVVQDPDALADPWKYGVPAARYFATQAKSLGGR